MNVPETLTWRRFARLTLKELRETLRDRRTIVTLLAMPLLVYPLLGIAFQKLFLSQALLSQPMDYHLAFENEADAIEFRNTFSIGNRRLGRELSPGSPLPPKPGETADPGLQFIVPDSGQSFDALAAVEDGEADIAIRMGPLPTAGRSRQIELSIREGSALGRQARDYIIERLRAINDAYVEDHFRREHPDQALPVAWTSTMLKGEARSDFSLATLVPLVLILMTVTGAVYPAIDLTAGERERGTLEGIISAPISRGVVLVAKYVAVVSVAVLTAVMNLLAMLATALGTGLDQVLFGPNGASPLLFLQILLLLVVFASFFSALILAITSLARSFKEAQAYLIPVMLFALTPGVMALLPGLSMTPATALAPLLNIVLAARDLLDGRASPLLVGIALTSCSLYAALAVYLAARIFGTDSVLYGSSGTFIDGLKRPAHPHPAEPVHAILALGGVFPAYVLLGGLPSRLADWSLNARLGLSAVITVLLFVLWPIALAWYLRLPATSTFGLRRARPLAYLAAVLAGVSLWPWAYEIELLTLSRERVEQIMRLFKNFETELGQVPIALKLTALAIVPAVCEEFFFRGLLFRAFRQRLSAAVTIVSTALLFGLFHVLVRDALFIERLIPTSLMGLVLGWVAHRMGSTLPGMLLHTVHNSTLLLLPIWYQALNEVDALSERRHLPASTLVVAAVIATIGLSLLASRFVRRDVVESPESRV